MFENEGLRLRTIEINAEVERGQSDLRKLKRENETLKQQVWTLRDEYDKLETLVKEMEDEQEEDEDDDEEEEEEEEEELESEEISHNKQCAPKIAVHDEKSGHDTNFSESENLDNLQKVYSGQMRSVEYTLRQGAEINDGVMHLNQHTACSGPHLACGAQPDTSGVVRMQVPEEQPLLIASSDIPTHVSSDGSHQHADPYLSQADHFNLDQLLDFASSFHYDRRKHMASEEESALSVTVPKDEDCSISTSDDNVNKTDDKGSSASASGFSTIRRRSSTVIEKLKGVNSSALVKEVKQVSLCKDGVTSSGIAFSETPEVSNETTTVSYTRSSYYFAGSLDGRSQSLGTGLNAAASAKTPGTPVGPLYSSSSASNIASGTTSSSLDSNLPLVSVFSQRTPSMVRLSSIEPNTIMVSVTDMPQLWDICTQEIIDELERQVSSTMPDIRGVRVASRAAYISLGHRETLQQLLECGLTVRGSHVPLIDITRESIVVALTGVPHYIADATLSILLSAFGTIIGEIERRFYKGVDTGERFVRMKLKKHVKLPKYVTVGGCRIVLALHGSERPLAHIQEWSNVGVANPLPSPTPHTRVVPAENISEYGSSISQDSGQCTTAIDNKSESVRIGLNSGQSSLEAHYHKQSERRDSIKGPKTFASRCVVNLKVPDRTAPSISTPRVAHREAPLPPSNSGVTIGMGPVSSSINAGQLLRAGSLGRNPRSSNEDHPSGLVVPQVSTKSPIVPRKNRATLADGRQDTPRPRPTSVAFEDNPREQQHIRPPPPLPQVPPHIMVPHNLANGILRKPSVTSSEQEALLPSQTHGPTATIRNRLKIGRSVSYDSGKQKQGEKEKKKKPHVRKMESISENALSDDLSDVTPLGGSRSRLSRRDSEKSSASEKSGSNKPRKEVIDLPWCGCWGNGCF